MWTSWQLLRHFGPRWAAYRVKYALERKSGLRASRDRVRAWEHVSLASLMAEPCQAEPEELKRALTESRDRFFFSPDFVASTRPRLLRFDDEDVGKLPVRAADRIAAGRMNLFHVHEYDVGTPPAWHRNAITGERTPEDQHWSRIDDFAYGDIKVIWDLNRFNFAFDLARAYARTEDEQWAELFWSLLEDWRLHNPPNLGANWKCGQEASLRAMAWCFALFTFARCDCSSPERVANLAQMLAFTGSRVADNIQYAVSQKNNHGVSEAVGLLAISTVLPALKQADHWRQTARRVLRQLAEELIYHDGGFSQHSWNYHRLMLHDYVWAIRLGEVTGDPLPADVVERVGRAGELLHQVMDDTTGEVPCYGQDDGSLIFPLNNCSYFDYRPVVQATAAVTSGQQVLPGGPWDEDLHWLFAGSPPDVERKRTQKTSFSTPVSGYAVLRSEEGMAFTRAASFQHRPAQADMLHVDIRWRGLNIAVDPGTFSYNAPSPWDNPLATAHYHNTVTVDGEDQMKRVGRFVWLPWLNSKSLGPIDSESGKLAHWQGEHDGYQRLRSPVRHRRGIVRLPGDHWLVIDRVESDAPHDYRLHWLLADWPHAWSPDDRRLRLEADAGDYHVHVAACESSSPCSLSVVRADEASPRGWRAHGYQRKRPAISLAADVHSDSVWFWSALGPELLGVTQHGERIRVAASSWQAELIQAVGATDKLLSEISLTGEHLETLRI